MKKKLRTHTKYSRSGSSLLVVILLVTAASLVVGSVMKYSLSEMRLNYSNLLHNESRIAAEAVLNHGMAQIYDKMNRVRQLTTTELIPDQASALELEPEFLALAGQTRMVVPTTYTRPANYQAFKDADTIVGGIVVNDGDAVKISIDPNIDIGQVGKLGVPTSTEVREVRIYSKATVTDPQWGSRTSYMRQTFQVLDRSLFQNSTFFNGLLEIFPGAGFNLGVGGGPIYGEQINIGNNVRVHTRIETPGDFTIGRYHNSNDRGDNAFLTDFDVYDGTVAADPNNVPYLVGVIQANDAQSGGANAGNGGLQTGVPGFREKALQAYNGGLLTGEHGVETQAAVGLDFLQDLAIQDDAANGVNYQNAAGEFDQGLYDRIGGNYGHRLIEPSRGIRSTTTPGLTAAEIEAIEAANSIEENKWVNRSGLVIELDTTTNSVRMFSQSFTVDGKPAFNSLTGLRERTEIDLATNFPDADAHFWEVQEFSQPGGAGTSVDSGIYDFRQAEGSNNSSNGEINLLRIDMSKMRKWVEESWTSTDVPSGDYPTFNDDWWNGGVYVEIPENPPATPRADEVVPAVSNWAVQIHDAETLPNRYVVNNDSNKGLTFATNGALYIEGTYNAPQADLDLSTFATTQGAEVPAALVADAVMLLSDNWDNSKSGLNKSNRDPVDTVYSAAIVTGNVPSTSAGQYSGGLENFPRFLENWGGTVTYRGSLIRLFRSESFNARWGSSNVYSAPNRNWSFHVGFREHSPPLDVGPRSFRRVFFKELSQAEFENETQNIFNTVVAGP